MKNMRGPGKSFCSSEFFASIECRTVVGHNHPKKTGQNVECSLERGLLCTGQCFDYEIRVYCECGDITAAVTSPKPFATSTQQSTIVTSVPIIPAQPAPFIKVCDPSLPIVEHPFSCLKFLQCDMAPNGSFVFTEKTCGATLMFNPKSMVCDWPWSVAAVKPKCATKPEEPVKYQRECPTGYVYSDCAIPCNRACNYYDQQLKLSGNCTLASHDCIPGCMPIGSVQTCELPKLWRDWNSCVDIKSCTCMGPNNEILKVKKNPFFLYSIGLKKFFYFHSLVKSFTFQIVKLVNASVTSTFVQTFHVLDNLQLVSHSSFRLQ